MTTAKELGSSLKETLDSSLKDRIGGRICVLPQGERVGDRLYWELYRKLGTKIYVKLYWRLYAIRKKAAL